MASDQSRNWGRFISDHDLLEDSVAALAYAVTFTVVLALLVQFPALQFVGGLTGFAAHAPALYTSRLARRGFVWANEN